MCKKKGHRKRCDKCRQSYEAEMKRNWRKLSKIDKIKTRNKSKKSESLYLHVLCADCRNSKRSIRDLCESVIKHISMQQPNALGKKSDTWTKI